MSAAFRMLAAAVFALFVAAFWTTPSEAHAGHGGAASAPQSRAASSLEAVSHGAVSEADRAVEAAVAQASDCRGQGAVDGELCCSTVCHAAISEALSVLTPLPIEAAPALVRPQPAAHSGPTLHIKRPPRAPALTAG